jgi:hypothetical protein
MSNKKVLVKMTLSEAKAAGITSLADRPNQASKYGDGGLSAQALKERFDALPNLVRERFNAVSAMLEATDAPRYITIGDAESRLGETLYDFLALFSARGDGVTDKNISDYIEVLYQKDGDNMAVSYPLGEIIADMHSRQTAIGDVDKKITDAIQSAITDVLNTEVEG